MKTTFKAALLASAFILSALPALAQYDLTSNSTTSEIANASSTGTTINKLAKLTGAPSTAVIAATTDTAVLGVVMGGAGTTGNAQIAVAGQASCVFDGATTAGDYVQISSSTGGDCHDTGSGTLPSSGGSILGRVLSTNGSGGTYALVLFGTGNSAAAAGGSGTVASSTIGQVAVYTGSTTVTGGAAFTASGGAATLGTANTTQGSVIVEGGTSGALTVTTQAVAGTPTWTAGTSSGTPVVTASSPLAITTATGNITCATCSTTSGTVTSITPAAGVASTNTGGTTAITSSGSLFADASYFPFYLGGLTLSNDGTTPTTVLDVAAGAAASDDIGTGGTMMKLAAFTGSISGTWTVGSGNNKLDTGSIAASTWYHVFEIERTDTSVVDILFSLSPTSPTMPTNYTKKRRLGSFKTNGSSQITTFTQRGAIFYWGTQVLDVNTSSLGTTQVLETLGSVPTGVVVQPLCRYSISNTGNSVILTSGDETNVAPTTTTPFSAAPGFDQLDASLTAGDQNTACPFLTTNTSGQIGARGTAASTTLAIVTRGWID